MSLDEQPGLIERYYEEVLSAVRPKFTRYSFKTNKTVICPLHDDNDPSLGVIMSKGKERFHCFGCGAWGGVRELAERAGKIYPELKVGKNVDEYLVRVLGLVPSLLEGGTDRSGEHPIAKRRRLMRQCGKEFGRDDFREGVLDVINGSVPIGVVDTLLVTTILMNRRDDE